MDFYCYYKERFTWGSNPYESVAKCKNIVEELIENTIIPSRIAAESAVGFLAALADFSGDGCSVIVAYDTVMNSTTEVMQRMRNTVNDAEQAWLLEILEDECADGRGPAYDPGDYVVEDVDLDGNDLPEEPEPGEPDLLALEQLYGVAGEAGTTGTRRPFPDWAHIDSWTQSDWVKLQVFKDKMLAAAGHDFFAMGSVTNALAAAKDVMPRVPLRRQVELAMWAEELVDLLISGMESSLREMCAESLHSHQGRQIQKQLIADTRATPEKQACLL